MSNTCMPAVFFGHGSPMVALQPGRYGPAWRGVAEAMPKPRAVLMVSAHWYTRGIGVTAMARPRTIHDFGGFPRALSEVQYPAPGDPALAQRVRELLAPADVQADQQWGLDHGAWSVLMHAWPQADVPVVQLSMDAGMPAAMHYRLARQLAPLRDEGVLIAGSGNIVHNLRMIRFDQPDYAYDWATRFDMRIAEALLSGDHDTLINYLQLGRDAQLSVPTAEHYLPLLYVAAQQRDGEPLSFPVEGVEMGSLSMRAVALGLQAV